MSITIQTQTERITQFSRAKLAGARAFSPRGAKMAKNSRQKKKLNFACAQERPKLAGPTEHFRFKNARVRKVKHLARQKWPPARLAGHRAFWVRTKIHSVTIFPPNRRRGQYGQK